MKKQIKNHLGVLLALIVLIIIGYLTSSGGIWLTKIYPEESENIGIGVLALIIVYIMYKVFLTIFNNLYITKEINHQNR